MTNKYLSDGRKVAIIGKLNNNETIVQEIFVTDKGDEIPSGENFTVKSLHDEPVKSWKETSLDKIGQKIKKYESMFQQAHSKYETCNQSLKGIQALLMQSKKLIDLLPEQDLETFTMFMTGTVEYLVIDSYSISPPEKMIDKIIKFDSYYSERRYDSIKLLTVSGKSDGVLDYCINQYSDGSGSSISCRPFSSKEKALSHIKTRFLSMVDKGRVTSEDYKACVGMGIVFSKEEVDEYKKIIKLSIKASIKNHKVSLDKSQKIMDGYKKQLVDL